MKGFNGTNNVKYVDSDGFNGSIHDERFLIEDPYYEGLYSNQETLSSRNSQLL